MLRTPDAEATVEATFHRAAAAVAALEHPRIVPLYSAGATDRVFWCSMPYVEGRSLADRLQRDGPLELNPCLRLAQQVADALDFAHRLGVIHAGLTPANVLLDASGDAHVTDFWVPWTLSQLGALARSREDPGAAPYLAPEQRVRREPSPAGDQYALATLVYACLTGAPPLVEDAMAAIAGGRNPEPPPRLGEVRPDLPAWVSTAVERAMSRAPDGRYATALDFVAALQERRSPAPNGVALGLFDDESIGRRPAHRWNWRWIPAGALTLVVLGAVVAPWLRNSASTGDRTAASDTASVAPAPVDSLALAAAAPARTDTMLVPSTLAPSTLTVRPPGSTDAPPRRTSVSPPPRRTPVPRSAARSAPRAGDVAGRLSPGRLFVNATPWGQVYVDDAPVGNTPQIGLPVTPGAHRLRVVRDGFEPYEVAIRVAPGQELRITDIVLREVKP
jgi:serine/threonine-protein kinase